MYKAIGMLLLLSPFPEADIHLRVERDDDIQRKENIYKLICKIAEESLPPE